MKTPSFWYPEPNDRMWVFLAVLLSPLSWLFKVGTFIRRLLTHPYRARVPIICVGNVVAGGAGKTPTALALARILKKHGQKPVFVTRGYGGHGELTCVDPTQHDVQDVGDEALLLASFAPTWACRDRVAAARHAESHGTFIIMDDGLQNPALVHSVSILVIDGDVGIGNGHIIPAGPLRENLSDALERVTALIVIGTRDSQNLAIKARVPVFRAHLKPSLPEGLTRQGKFIAFAGIARPEKFYATAREVGLDIVGTCDFADHYLFTQEDIDALRLQAEERGARLLTTAKDAVRLPADFRAEIVILSVSLTFNDPGAEAELARLCISSCAL